MKNRDQQLRLFLEITQCQSLSKAADVLGLTQSALSKQLASLEQFIGQPLFERTGRGVSLNDAGRKLQDVAHPAYELIDAVVQRLQEQQGVTEGTLCVATIHTLSFFLVGDAIARFMGQKPLVSVTMLGRSSPEVVELVESGKADIGFVYDTAVASDAVAITPLFQQTMCVIAHEDSQFARDSEIGLRGTEMPMIAFPPSYALRRMLRAEGLDAHVVAEVETVDAMLKLASVTQGQCILPEGIPPHFLKQHNLVQVRVVDPVMVRRVVAITRLGRAPSALTILMLEIAKSTMS